MELCFKHQLGLVCVIQLFLALCSWGARGFGEYGRKMNNGCVATVSRLWRNGAGCGTCYQVWCKMSQYCNDEGVYVAATDYGEGDRTD
ncbi:hypothetical protein JHK82_011989 [Glycine max]|uniref:Expansin-like EG45 domain-containing protein n=2 Tax=Glycine subgen. Soja TaxID=1462606 RepID=K7KN80_SOYBN|nr:hypothetical protein JHK85_012311 [Glycine max]KAG5056987.1 hypothetical protein JHK86_011983 [Glycine max]KAG5154020.1 hypothetical protein JHK82_011989 [Glycine max]KAH1133103.1 hypothetical protein GYH30_011785 [Glycine max]KRH57506.1 hypothetical protein GLYMA_05G065100v4 [Glycine max]